MRAPVFSVSLATLLLATMLPASVMADQIMASSRIIAVTIYPEAAEVTREITFKAPAGAHDLLITDLPADIVPDLIRLASPDLRLGAFSLRSDRLPPRDKETTPALAAARAELESAQGRVALAEAGVNAINAHVEAAEAQVGFLRGIKAEGGALTAEALQTTARMVGSETLAARQAALAAAAELPAAQKTLADARDALAKAQAALDALSRRDEDYAALSVSVELASEGEGHLTLKHYVSDAGWRPVYDINLTRGETASLAIGRGVLVSQSSGEDWVDVALTLSTAQPTEQSEASRLQPELRRIGDPEPQAPDMPTLQMRGEAVVADMAEPVMEPAPVTASASFQGDVVVYNYPGAVSVASGVEDLRLALDKKLTTARIEARAIPRYDQTAFLLASFTNDTGDILLPGQAFLTRDSTLVGSSWITGVAPGDDYELGFGAIEGLRLERNDPQRSEGDRGIITSSTQLDEKAILHIENLTAESWPVRLMDQIPYSEQDDLQITYSATPQPSETDVKGQRGILAWDFDLPAGASKDILLDTQIRWPKDKVLQ